MRTLFKPYHTWLKTRNKVFGLLLAETDLLGRTVEIWRKVATFAQTKHDYNPMKINKALIFTVVAVILTGFALQSCEDDDNYGERKKKERRIVKSFIKKGTTILAADANDTLVYVPPINVISESQFEKQDSTTDVSKNEYVYFPQTGIYMQIVRKGTGEKLKSGSTATILCRYTEVNLRGDSIQTSNQNSYFTEEPDVMTVSNTLGTFTASFVSGVMYKSYGSSYSQSSTSVPKGWLVPLTYIKIGRQSTADEQIARVRLIVPDAQGQLDASENVYACYYDITYQRGYR